MEAAHGREAPPPPAGPPTSTGRAGRNLPVAIGVGLALGALVLVSLYTVKEIFLGVMTVFLALAVRELTQAFGSRQIRVPQAPAVAGIVAALLAAYLAGPLGLAAALALTVLVLLTWRMRAGAEGYVRDATAALFIVGYVMLMGGVVALMLAPDDGADRITIFIAVTVSSDIGGYFAGAFLGRHKMAPTISPKKTWEGFAGSALTCMVVGAWLVPWRLDDGHLWQGALLGAAVVCTAVVGDLVESLIKRDLGLKDLGTLLPGHGGVMDRLDSLIMTAPVVWLLLELFVRTS
ncbi:MULTISPECIES: phosphatidate cytidylyltransferase [Thermomonospora]|uniref:Phosphatidate cytidylyltransferase n=1 Tax=Thermomonospora cellulosilytica TaxID=1411118 RepID=A0A7W3RCA3_9ACTN|nr:MULTISPECIES: phosphatidate cytidylyltransferase [Thermomonospora]MBA9007095.1 phosphatidate cytidylyltransferase [Thermomonospora cellulosilytica]